MLKEVNEESYG